MAKSSYTFEELKTFVLAQKDDRGINMMHSAPCDGSQGCILVQFARKKYKKKIESVGYSALNMANKSVLCIDRDEQLCFDYIYACVNANVQNYKKAKEILKQKTK
jgi:uncharacterized protein (DUF1499 family)